MVVFLITLFKNKEDFENYKNTVKKIKEKIEDYDGLIRVITHHDSDGLNAGGIILKILYRLGKDFHLSVFEHLTTYEINKLIEEYKKNKNTLYIFADMGSGQIDALIKNKFNCIILDHHPPSVMDTEIDNILQLNPHIFGMNGSREVSGSGVSYLVGREFGYYDLSMFAISGAIGDMQHKPFIGINKFILNEGRLKNYILNVVKDIIYNCYDLPLWQSILYNTDPYIREFKSKGEVIEFLEKIGLNPNKPYLEGNEKHILADALSEYVDKEKLWVDRYIIRHKIGDALYLSEIVNSSGRLGYGGIGLGAILEDEECIRKGKCNYIAYKEKIINEIKSIKIKSLKNIEYFYGKKGITGLIASLLVKDKPVIGFYKDGEYYKVSSRGNDKLVSRGLNLTEAMKLAEKYGGSGGGHNVASGAKIHQTTLDDFLRDVDELIGKQLNSKLKI